MKWIVIPLLAVSMAAAFRSSESLWDFYFEKETLNRFTGGGSYEVSCVVEHLEKYRKDLGLEDIVLNIPGLTKYNNCSNTVYKLIDGELHKRFRVDASIPKEQIECYNQKRVEEGQISKSIGNHMLKVAVLGNLNLGGKKIADQKENFKNFINDFYKKYKVCQERVRSLEG